MVIEEVAIPVGERSLDAKLYMPDDPVGFVVLAGGDARIAHVATLFALRGIAALVVDAGEDLVGVVDSVFVNGLDRGCPIGVFGDTTVLLAASRRPEIVTAVVAYGDRHEHAIAELEAIRAPTLFLIGSSDLYGLQQARSHARKMIASTHVIVVPGANAAFTQPGAFDEIAEYAMHWFEEHFRRQTPVKIAAAR